MSYIIVIPARYHSTRLPGKPLLAIGSKPMLQHVYERAQQTAASAVIIATDDKRIQAVAESFGAQVCLTAAHPSGTDRLQEVVSKLGYKDDTLVVNVQGDEPLIAPQLIEQVANNLAQSSADVATLCYPISQADDLFNPNLVKVVFDQQGYALYFSRAPIPWARDGFAKAPKQMPQAQYYRHIGLYAYRAALLQRYVKWQPCELERLEALEQLRVLWYGGKIHVAVAKVEPVAGVDTPADLERVTALMHKNPPC